LGDRLYYYNHIEPLIILNAVRMAEELYPKYIKAIKEYLEI